MTRYLLAAGVLAADLTIMLAARPPEVRPVVVYALAAAAVVVSRFRSPAAAFCLALVLSALSGLGQVLMLWAAYHAGREVVSRSGLVRVVGAAAGALTVQMLFTEAVPQLLSISLIFVVLPLLAGRYVAQQSRLVSALHLHNAELRRHSELISEQERLRERLRIARDMHDSLGHRLSLVSIQAAALEVADLPAAQRQGVQQLARSARGALDELYELVGALRQDGEGASPGLEGIEALVHEFRSAGVEVTLRQNGQRVPMPAAAGHAAYRVVEEGLTNAAKHAAGQPVTVSLDWEPDALLLTIANPVAAAVNGGGGPGHGLRGLAERLRLVHGFVDHGMSDKGFRLFAMLPAPPAELPVADPGRWRVTALGVAMALLMFVVIPAGMMLGAR